MNRVWKRFLTKVANGAGVVAYVLSSMLIPGEIAHRMGYDTRWGILIGAGVFVIAPMIFYIIRDVYRDAKREIEWENKEMMRTLRGDDNSDLYEN